MRRTLLPSASTLKRSLSTQTVKKSAAILLAGSEHRDIYSQVHVFKYVLDKYLDDYIPAKLVIGLEKGYSDIELPKVLLDGIYDRMLRGDLKEVSNIIIELFKTKNLGANEMESQRSSLLSGITDYYIKRSCKDYAIPTFSLDSPATTKQLNQELAQTPFHQQESVVLKYNDRRTVDMLTNISDAKKNDLCFILAFCGMAHLPFLQAGLESANKVSSLSCISDQAIKEMPGYSEKSPAEYRKFIEGYVENRVMVAMDMNRDQNPQAIIAAMRDNKFLRFKADGKSADDVLLTTVNKMINFLKEEKTKQESSDISKLADSQGREK